MALEDLDLQRVMAREPKERDIIRIIGKCDAIRPENRSVRRVCKALADVLAIKAWVVFADVTR
jgi:hypothetical protein